MSEGTNYIGLDLGEMSIRSALTDRAGEILEIGQQTIERKDPAVLSEQVIDIIRRLREKGRARGYDVRAIGVGVPGLVNPASRRVVASPNLPPLEHADLHEEIRRSSGLDIVFDNDANMAAYGELTCGSAVGMKNVIYVTIGTGIGAGLILDGKIYRGSLGYAGEFGHMTLDPDGLECACGNQGCLETIASGPNIVRRTRERLFRDRSSSLSALALPEKGEMTPEKIAMEALNGDDFSLMIIEQTGKWIGTAVANVINLLNLDMVVLGGGVMMAGDLLLHPIIQEAERRSFASPFNHCKIVAATLGGQAGVIGAAMLARDAT
ncbi:MAG: ROK family protein [Acidobacteria bacterium]|nr:ROK family protein [Acidobacteriota bacterium]